MAESRGPPSRDVTGKCRSAGGPDGLTVSKYLGRVRDRLAGGSGAVAGGLVSSVRHVV